MRPLSNVPYWEKVLIAMNVRTALIMGILLISGGIAVSAATGDSAALQEVPPMAIYAPDRILFNAERSGLWSPSTYPLNFEINPFYLRGDFNGDGANDLAFWVTEASSGKRGIAIIHSTLDTLWVFGAGHLFQDYGADQIWVDTWYVLPKGTKLNPRRSIPEVGFEEGKEFIFKQEAVSPMMVAKSSFAIYWHNGRYHYIPVSD
ncbi:hypothetical protein ACFL3X_00860 [Gemmatimonadota bacterium]